MEVLDGYIRVSQVGGRQGARFISPSEQRQQIETWVHSSGARLGEVFEELDESGARADRPLLIEAIERVERGESGGLVVAKLDRFGRSVVDGLEAIRRIEQAGGTFVSVQDGLDLGTATGRLVLGVLFSIGEWELGRLRGSWDVAKKRAIARGAYVGGEPIGYRKSRDGRLQIEPVEAVLIREIFERRGRGQPYTEIAADLNRRGKTTRLGRSFRTSTLSTLVRNPAYRGEARHGPHHNPTAHEPIVDPALWQLCQRTPPRRRDRDTSLLGGLVRCATCGRMMRVVPLPRRAPRSHAYSCDLPGDTCSGRAYARAEDLEPLVEEFFFEQPSPPTSSAEEMERRNQAEVAGAQRELLAYRAEPSIRAALDTGSFAAGLAARQRRLELSLAKQEHARRDRLTPKELAGLARDWPRFSCDERRQALGRSVGCVVIEPGRRALRERVRVFWNGEAPVWRKPELVIAADLLAGAGARPKAARSWPPDRLEAELGEFLANRRDWPTYREFAAAGRARLFAQTLAYGGPFFWGPRFGVRVARRYLTWNRERIRGALAPLLKDRSEWPRRMEFLDAGMLAVYEAAHDHGGFPFWASEFGCRYRNHRELHWSERRIEAELTEFTAERSEFPSRCEFYAAEKRTLYEAMCRRGGVAHWSARFRTADAA